MSALVDALTALGKQLAANNSADTAPHLKAIDDHLTAIDTKQGADEATIADQAAALQAFVDAATPPVATPAPTVAPTA